MTQAAATPSLAEFSSRLGALENIYQSYLAWVGVTLGLMTLIVVVFGLFSFGYLR